MEPLFGDDVEMDDAAECLLEKRTWEEDKAVQKEGKVQQSNAQIGKDSGAEQQGGKGQFFGGGVALAHLVSSMMAVETMAMTVNMVAVVAILTKCKGLWRRLQIVCWKGRRRKWRKKLAAVVLKVLVVVL